MPSCMRRASWALKMRPKLALVFTPAVLGEKFTSGPLRLTEFRALNISTRVSKRKRSLILKVLKIEKLTSTMPGARVLGKVRGALPITKLAGLRKASVLNHLFALGTPPGKEGSATRSG